jgi:hypothetical protein
VGTRPDLGVKEKRELETRSSFSQPTLPVLRFEESDERFEAAPGGCKKGFLCACGVRSVTALAFNGRKPDNLNYQAALEPQVRIILAS